METVLAVSGLLALLPLLAQPSARASPPAEPCAIQGRVSNRVTGAPLRKAALTFVAVESPQNIHRAVSDANGRFTLPSLASGPYRVTAQRENFLALPRSERLVTIAGCGTRVNLSLSPAAVVSGRVFDDEGEPLPGAAIQLLREIYTNGRRRTVSSQTVPTNDLGEYRMFNLQPGRYYLHSATTPGQSPRRGADDETYAPVFYPGSADSSGALPLTLAPGSEARNLDFHLQRIKSAVVRGGIIAPSGVPAQPAQLMMQALTDIHLAFENRLYLSLNPATGEFQSPPVVPGPYVITARTQDGATVFSARERVDLSPGEQRTLELTLVPAVTIQGSLRLEGDAPLNLKQVHIRLSSSDGIQPASSLSATVDNGLFTVPNVPPGRWEFGVVLPPGSTYIQSARLGTVDLLAGDLEIASAAPDKIAVVLSPRGGRVEGTVTSGTPAGPSPGAVVYLASDTPGRSQFVTADAAGRYTIPAIAPGAYRLYAFRDADASAVQDPLFLRTWQEKAVALTVAENARLTQPLIGIATP